MTGCAARIALIGVAACWPISPDATAADGLALKALVAAYPDYLKGTDGNALVWRDGSRMAIEDGVQSKSFDRLLNAPDIGDQFAFAYPLGALDGPPAVNADPGRIRYQPLFEKIYGDCEKGDVKGRLRDVVWLPRKWGRKIAVTTVNGVADRLVAISRELDALPARFDRFLFPPAGSYNCRTIAGTGRKSVHAFGAAIDLNVRQAHYWRWTKPDAAGRYAYRNRIPNEIVEIFERHGFIWGGKWYHYDTMHFEYRPELIALARMR